ncbi:MAG: hypothetical protein OQJ96_01400 [Flavobacteriales bacterium]|nr:hypothetical protein [Flavobacteriales bacterium]MCW8912578.1 hypothetical protein [Flavobacteriales bacterium]MCW8938183.1 hypothetical protein [Flavobacteriales bacterium]MCW8941015.1 hypothetical protein [Flavobacteriales bacterium]MCW8967025.1 hypothetical protein [Flavobacteriales bacterium]
MLPNFRDQFKTDLIRNFKKKSNNLTTNLFIPDIEMEGVMYACLMCLEFKNNAGILPTSIIDEMTEQVTDVLKELFDEYNESHKLLCIFSVHSNMGLSNISQIVNEYYQSY